MFHYKNSPKKYVKVAKNSYEKYVNIAENSYEKYVKSLMNSMCQHTKFKSQGPRQSIGMVHTPSCDLETYPFEINTAMNDGA